MEFGFAWSLLHSSQKELSTNGGVGGTGGEVMVVPIDQKGKEIVLDLLD